MIVPAYNYLCEACKEALTIVRGITEEETKPDCPKCGDPMSRDYKVAGLVFKGNGWGKQAR